MGPGTVQRQRGPHPLRGPFGGDDRRRHPRAVAALGLIIALSLFEAPTAGAAPEAGAGQGRTREWIVTLEPDAVAPEGVSVSGRRFRLDTASGRVAARGRAQRTDQVIDRLEGRLGLRVRKRFGWSMQGFTASMTGAEAAALRTDPSVASVVPNAPASIAADSVPMGVERIGATNGIATGEDVDIDVAVIDTGVGPVGSSELVYRLQSVVPEHWIPFVPVETSCLKNEM